MLLALLLIIESPHFYGCTQDLTTSNMMLQPHAQESERELVLIDFGLSFVSTSAEDKVRKNVHVCVHACVNREAIVAQEKSCASDVTVVPLHLLVIVNLLSDVLSASICNPCPAFVLLSFVCTTGCGLVRA